MTEGKLFFESTRKLTAASTPSTWTDFWKPSPTLAVDISIFQDLILKHMKASSMPILTIGDSDWPNKDIPIYTTKDLDTIQMACGMKIVTRKVYHDRHEKDISGDYFYDIYTNVFFDADSLIFSLLASRYR
jgi:hypothetical protein